MACALCGSTEQTLEHQRWEGVCQVACSHRACAPCLRQWIEKQLPEGADAWHVEVPCFAPDCSDILPHALVQHVSAAARAPVRRGLAFELRAARLRSVPGLVCRWPPASACPHCKAADAPLLENRCGHLACESCWTGRLAREVPHWRARRQREPRCPDPQCSQAVEEHLWRHLCDVSWELAGFHEEVSTAVARLTRTAAGQLVWPAAGLDAGLQCERCSTLHLALLRNTACQHTACEDCWTSWAVGQVPTCRAEEVVQVRCCGGGCSEGMVDGIWHHAAAQSAAVREFAEHIETNVARLLRTAGDLLEFAPDLCSPGPVCGICRHRRLALLENPGCRHAACEDCWASWAAEQLDRCRAEKQPALRCIAFACQEPVAPAAWAHSCTRSDAVAGLEKEFARRHQIQGNDLYPPTVQVDCPRDGCLGLGYLGFDTVMCFMCEHQWDAAEGAAPTGLTETFAGEVMKKCPACGEFIIKNGGCDHMTCRCRHEFWWTTLLPYRQNAS